MKKKYIYIFLFAIFLIGASFYYRYEIYPYQWNEAEKSFQLYIKAQHVDKNNIESIEKTKDKKTSSIAYLVKYKDDKDLTYVYSYNRYDTVHQYKMSLGIDDKMGNGIADTTPHKYPILEDLKKENNK